MYHSLTMCESSQSGALSRRIVSMLGLFLVMAALVLGGMESAYAETPTPPASEGKGLDAIANNITGALPAFVNLIIAACYVAGMALAGAAILKFKAHKDNPTQVPLGTPIALLFIGAALLWLPSIISSTGETMFGGDGKTTKMETWGSYGDDTSTPAPTPTP